MNAEQRSRALYAIARRCASTWAEQEGVTDDRTVDRAARMLMADSTFVEIAGTALDYAEEQR